MRRFIIKVRLFIAAAYISMTQYKIKKLVGGISIFWAKLLFPRLKVGKKGSFFGKVAITIYGDGEINIGNESWFVSDWKRAGITLFSPCKITSLGGKITLGNKVGLNGTVITSRKRIDIGDRTMIAPNTIIVDTDFHLTWPVEKRWFTAPEDRVKTDADVIIEKDVWIGMNCLILKGVTIGENSVIGAGSIVTRDIPKNVIAAGSPAKVLRELK